MSKFVTKIEHIPSITEIEMSASDLKNLLEPLGLRELYLWDNKYFYCSHEDWGKVFAKVLLGMPRYTAEHFDCENYSMLASARTSELFKLNTCGIAIVQGPRGYHGFNLFVSEAGLFYLEPQTGDIYSISENSGYKAAIAIFGG